MHHPLEQACFNKAEASPHAQATVTRPGCAADTTATLPSPSPSPSPSPGELANDSSREHVSAPGLPAAATTHLSSQNAKRSPHAQAEALRGPSQDPDQAHMHADNQQLPNITSPAVEVAVQAPAATHTATGDPAVSYPVTSPSGLHTPAPASLASASHEAPSAAAKLMQTSRQSQQPQALAAPQAELKQSAVPATSLPPAAVRDSKLPVEPIKKAAAFLTQSAGNQASTAPCEAASQPAAALAAHDEKLPLGLSAPDSVIAAEKTELLPPGRVKRLPGGDPLEVAVPTLFPLLSSAAKPCVLTTFKP